MGEPSQNDRPLSENGRIKKHHNDSSKGQFGVVGIRQATKKGYIECEIGGVADFSYPDSKLRRGRVQGGAG